MYTIKEIIQEYLSKYNEFKKGEFELPFDKLVEEIEEDIKGYFEYFNIPYKGANLLKKYFFSGVKLYEFTKDKLFLVIMVDFLTAILDEKIEIINKNDFLRTLNKILIIIEKEDFKEKLGEYGLYLIFAGVIRFFEDDIKNRECYKILSKTYASFKEFEKLKSSFDKDERKTIKIECNEDEFEYIKEVGDFFYWYLLAHKYSLKKGRFYKFRFIFEGKEIIKHAKYQGEIFISKIESELPEFFYKRGIQIVDIFEIGQKK